MANKTVATRFLQSSSEFIFLVSFTSAQCAVGSIANAVAICYFLSRRKNSYSSSDRLTLNLALADFVALTTYVPWRAYHLRQSTDNYAYYTSLFVACLFCTGNAVLLMALTRLVAILFPLKYRVFFTNKLANRMIVLSWTIAISLGIGHRVSLRDMGDFHLSYEMFLSFLSFCQLLAISSAYVMILRSTRQPKFQFQQRKIKISWTTYVIVILCFATFLQCTVYRVVTTANKSLTVKEKIATWRWIMAFSFFNSCCNPFLYLITKKKFKCWFRQFLNLGQ